ncbi:MAG: hypothetical protein B6D61_00125 [Bacteroidetes bacterium 4484_249]|nr:MAG: hypothetical protein B6D61_00125 [Bacteroidetes bacterium 4484_249]
MKKLIKLTIKGKVHGVGFRFSTMEAAYKYGVKGFVKNMSDGSVYVEAEGDENNLSLFKSWCCKGPLWARVEDVIEEIGTPQGYESFEIAR